jgi:uncharacterized protein
MHLARVLLRPWSNGEYAPVPPTPIAAEAVRRTLRDAEVNARRLGMDRRAFLRTSMGSATTLLALAACSDDEAGEGADPGGTFTVPPESTTETSAAEEAVGPATGEVIVDVQTHFLDPEAAGFGAGFPQAGCGDGAELCFTIDHWADLVLAASDTSVAVLSALPIVADDHPMSIEKMEQAGRLAAELCGDDRILLQGEAFPQVGELEGALEGMTALASAHPIVAWKTYTHVGGGYAFTDDVGQAFLAHVAALAADGIGPPVVAVHKGLGADPSDVGPAAAAFPELRFLVYHSGFETGVSEREFREDGQGVDRLVRSLRDAGVGPSANVYCELGSTWYLNMGSPTQAAHVLGKVLTAVGADRVLWGTDSIWYGTPQPQIEAFRAFDIAPELQETLGYPALTPEVKRGILGGNAAALHGLDLSTVTGPCRFTPEEREAAREEASGRLGPFAEQALGPVTRREALMTFRREHPWFG